MSGSIIVASPSVAVLAKREERKARTGAAAASQAGSGRGGAGLILGAAATGFSSFMRSLGEDPANLVERIGVPAKMLTDPSVEVGLPTYCTLFEEAARFTRHGNYGLWFGKQFNPFELGPIGEVIAYSPSLRAAVTNFVGLYSYFQQVTGTRLVQDGNFLHLEYRILDGRIVDRRQDAELTMGFFANLFWRTIGNRWQIEEVHFEHPRPEAAEEHATAFGAPVYFGQSVNALVFRDRDLDTPMPQADLQKMLRAHQKLVSIFHGAGEVSLLDRLSAEIRMHLPAGAPRIDDVSEGMGLSARKLQKDLAEMGTTFREVVETTRRKLSLSYLAQSHLSMSDVASLLGFSEASAFTRACRDWHGASPRMVRAAMALGCYGRSGMGEDDE